MREGERVTPLELFFDLVFVLALTQCTTLVTRTPTWLGVLKAMLVLGVLWWSWGGYAWLTSVVDPEEGTVRLAMFAAMAAFLVAALCVPGAFGSEALLFVCAYAAVRAAHIALNLRMEGGVRIYPNGAMIPNVEHPVEGDAIFFTHVGPEGEMKQIVTSRLERVDRPAKTIVALYPAAPAN